MIRSVVILGAGNVAHHLTRALLNSTVNVRQIYNRTLDSAQEIGESTKIRYTDKISELEKADLYLIATSDDAIEEISYHIPYEDVLVAHTSGTKAMDVLKGKYRKGVFYPMQTFSKDSYLNYSKIPFFIEAEFPEDEKDLVELAERVSGKAIVLDSTRRMKMHISAVMVNNFVNHLYTLASELSESNGVPFSTFMPLIQETTEKIKSVPPKEAQTGPARRGDTEVIEKHLNSIDDENLKKIYKDFSDSISKMYQDEL